MTAKTDPCPLCGRTGDEQCVTRSGRQRRESHVRRLTPAPRSGSHPGVRPAILREQEKQIRALRAQRLPSGKRRYKLRELAARFGTTEYTISRICRTRDHIPVPRRKRKNGS